jgi:hypothetical protein
MHDVLDDIQATLERRGLWPNTIATYLCQSRKFLEVARQTGDGDSAARCRAVPARAGAAGHRTANTER